MWKIFPFISELSSSYQPLECLPLTGPAYDRWFSFFKTPNYTKPKGEQRITIVLFWKKKSGAELFSCLYYRSLKSSATTYDTPTQSPFDVHVLSLSLCVPLFLFSLSLTLDLSPSYALIASWLALSRASSTEETCHGLLKGDRPFARVFQQGPPRNRDTSLSLDSCLSHLPAYPTLLLCHSDLPSVALGSRLFSTGILFSLFFLSSFSFPFLLSFFPFLFPTQPK